MADRIVRNAFDTPRVRISFNKDSRTVKHQRDQVDINQIVKRYQATGTLPSQMPHEPVYGDFTESQDYHAQLLRVSAAQDAFAALPSHLREHCNNDPGEFLALVNNPDGRTILEEAGHQDLAEWVYGPTPKEPANAPAPSPPAPAQDASAAEAGGEEG